MTDFSTPTTLAALLRQASSTDKTSNSSKKPEPRPTIFDLRKEDRYRILKLIEEMLDAQDEIDKLKSKIEEQRTDFSEKRNTLLKKLDKLNDKHEKTLSDMDMQKESYSANLKQLQEKIATVSDKFEASASEIKELRKTNAMLSEENAALKRLNSQIVALTSSYHTENLQNSFDVRKHKEKGHRRYLKTMSEARTNFDVKSRASLEASPNQEISVVRPPPQQLHENKARGYPGAGDFAPDNVSASGIETIKAPAIVILDKSNPSALGTLAQNNSQVVAPAFEVNKFQYPPLNFNSDDSAILENLFFRF